MKAVEMGVVTKPTALRLQEHEKQVEEVNAAILIEQNTQSQKVSREEIIKFYVDALKQGPMLLINYIIKEIKLFNDKVEIKLNNPIKKESR